MSQEIVKALTGPVETSFALLEKFIDSCPDDLWAEKKGGWPLWQQIYHAIGAIDFFIEVPGETPPAPLAPAGVGSLTEVAAEAVGKAEIKAALESAKGRVGKFLASLNDADLAKRNEPLFARAKFEMTLAGTVSMLSAHALYHIGSCDAALRDRGLPGVF